MKKKINEIRYDCTSLRWCHRRSVRLIDKVTPNRGANRDSVTTLYTVRVQARVLGFWLTLWAETCDFSDGDARGYTLNCAGEILEKLTAKI